jgi:hypothetical protein
VRTRRSFCQAKVHQLGAALDQHDVPGLQVAIDDALAMRDCERLGDCDPDFLNLSALKGEDSQATLRITTLTLAPEGSHRPHASGF